MDKFSKIKCFLFIAFLALTRLGFSSNSSQIEQLSLPEVIIGPEERRPVKKDYFEAAFDTLTLANERLSNLPEILDSDPIVQLIPSASLGDPPRFFIRGMDNIQTRFFLEGVPIGEPVFQSNSLLFLPTYALGELQLFPSVVPTFLLSPGLGGAVNVKIPDPSQRDFLKTELGSFGFVKGAARAPLLADSRLAIDYIQSEEDFSFWDNNGTPWNTEDDQLKTRGNDSFKRLTLMPFWKLDLGRGSRATLFSLNGFQNKEIPGSLETTEIHQLRERNHLSALKLLIPLELHWVLENSVYLRKNQEESLSLRQVAPRISNNSTMGGKLSVLFRENVWDARLGLGYETSEFVLNEAEEEKAAVSQKELPFSLAARFEIHPKMTLHPALLGVVSPGAGKTRKNQKVDSSLRMGLEFAESSELRFTSFFGSVFRGPSLSERFGLQPGVIGNAELENERALKADLGVIWERQSSWEPGLHQISFTIFGAQAQNLIAYVQDSSSSHRPENVSHSFWVGQELSAAFNLPVGLSIQPSLVSMLSRNRSEIAAEKGKQLPHLPPWRAKITSRWEKGNWGVAHHFIYLSESFTDKANLQKSEAIIIQDVSLGFSSKMWGRIELKVLNLFDKQVARVGVMGLETDQYLGGGNSFPIAGRRASISWTIDL